METYVKSIIDVINKLFEISHELKDQIKNLFSDFKSKLITRTQVIERFKNILKDLRSIPQQTFRINEQIKDSLLLVNNAPSSFLYVGYGHRNEGVISVISEHYLLPSDMVFVADPTFENEMNVTIIEYDDQFNLPLKNETIDLAVVFVVLHHLTFEERNKLLSEISRILTNDGILIIREHNSNKDENFETYIDLLHIFWFITKQETSEPLHLFSMNEFNQQLNNNNLFIDQIIQPPSDVPNPQRIYHARISKNNLSGNVMC